MAMNTSSDIVRLSNGPIAENDEKQCSDENDDGLH